MITLSQIFSSAMLIFMDFEKYYTHKQIAGKLGVTSSRVSQLIKKYKVPTFHLGRNSLYLKTDIEVFMEKRKKNRKFKGKRQTNLKTS